MEFENTFVVNAPVEEVWDLMLDVARVAPCMPGATVLEQTGDDAYRVAVRVKLGPMTMNYRGDVEIVDKDAAAHQATMRAKAKEARGQGTAQADVRMALRESDGGTAASIVTAMQMSGRAAAMGQGVIRDVAASLTDTFAQNLAGMMEGRAPEAAPAHAEAPSPVPSAPPAEPRAAAAPSAAPAGAPHVPHAMPVPETPTPEMPAAETPGAEAVRPEHHAEQPPPGPPPREPAGAAEPEAALPAGKIIMSVLAGRMRDPRAAGAVALAAFLLGVLVGRRGRS